MSTGSGDEERVWAADKRDFVADRRDQVADERDRVAETRDRTADNREAELDEWERQLDARAAELSGTAEESGASAQPAEARAGRSQARQNRDEAQAQRTLAAADRHESTKRRQADAPPTRLARVFADIAEQLYNADSFDDVLLRIANAAVSTIAGCRMASVTLSERSGYRTATSTDPAATAVDQAQYQSHEGPCLDAVDAPMVYAQSFPDERWPTLASGRQSPAYSRPFPTAWPRRTAPPPTQAADPSTPTASVRMRSTTLRRRLDSSWPRMPRWRPGRSMNAAPFRALAVTCSRSCCPEMSSARPKEF